MKTQVAAVTCVGIVCVSVLVFSGKLTIPVSVVERLAETIVAFTFGLVLPSPVAARPKP